MKKNALLLILWLLTNLLLAQNTPFTRAYKLYGDPMNTMNNFRQTSDHGFVLSSDHILQGPDSAGITTYGTLVKLDANGQQALASNSFIIIPTSKDFEILSWTGSSKVFNTISSAV